MPKSTVHGLTYEFDSYDALAEFFGEQAKRARAGAMRATTQKATRYEEGQAAAYAFVAEFMSNVEVA